MGKCKTSFKLDGYTLAYMGGTISGDNPTFTTFWFIGVSVLAVACYLDKL